MIVKSENSNPDRKLAKHPFSTPCFGTGAGFASARSSGLLESDRCRESGAAASLPYVSGSRPKTRVAGFAARPVIHPAVGRATPRGGARQFARIHLVALAALLYQGITARIADQDFVHLWLQQIVQPGRPGSFFPGHME